MTITFSTIPANTVELFAFPFAVAPSQANPRLRRSRVSVKKTEHESTREETAMREKDNAETAISLQDLRNNQAGAWEAAYRHLWKVGWLTARRKLPYDSKEQLEDLLSQVIGREIVPQIIAPKQEAFVKATSFDDILNLTSRILSNRAIDEIRKRTRRPEASDIERVPEGEFATPEESENKGRAEEVQLALVGLEERYRVIIEDFYFDELSTEEIARKRGRPKGSICSDLVKARQLLGSILSSQNLSTLNQ